MDLSFFKNPIILAIIAAALTYAYMHWENKKKKEENPKAEIEEVSYTTPAIVGILTLFITYSFFGFSGSSVSSGDAVGEVIEQSKVCKLVGGGTANLLGGGNSGGTRVASDGMTDTFNSNTYHLVGKNAIRLPQTDVFIDIAKF